MLTLALWILFGMLGLYLGLRGGACLLKRFLGILDSVLMYPAVSR